MWDSASVWGDESLLLRRGTGRDGYRVLALQTYCLLIQGQQAVQPSKAHWSLYVPHSGHYMYRQFNVHKLYVLPTQCIYVFCVDLRTGSDYFPIQH
jgi:hypothetical protein